MKMRKKLFFLLCVILGALLLAACGTNGTEYSGPLDIIDTSETAQDDTDYVITEVDTLDEQPLSAGVVLIDEDDRTQLWEDDIAFFARTIRFRFPLFRTQSSPADTPESVLSWSYGDTFTAFPTSPSMYMFNAKLLQEFDEMIYDLTSRIPYLTDFEIVMGLSRALTITGDCHSSVFFPRSYGIPLTLTQHFDEQHSETSYPFSWPHITGAYIGIDSVVNTRLVAINGIDISEIFNRMRPLFPHENEVGFRTLFSVNALFKELLQYIGVIGDEYVVPITVRDVNGHVFTVDAPLMPANSAAFFAHHITGRDNFPRAEMTNHIIDAEEFFAWSRPNENIWYKYFPEENMLYLRARLARESSPSSMQVFHDVIDTIMEQGGVDTFVLDFRGNTGGGPMEGITRLFSWARADENRELLGSFYIVVDSRTYSMGVIEAYMFRNFIEDAMLIGEPPSGGLNFFGMVHQFQLRNSGITVFGTSAGVLLDPYNQAATNTLYPDIFVHRTLEDYVNHHDAVIEAIRVRRSERAE